MVNPVMGRSNENIFQPAHASDQAGMVPKLGKEVQGRHHGDDFGRYAHQRQGDVEKEVYPHKTGNGLPQGTSQVELFTAVMHNMAYSVKRI